MSILIKGVKMPKNCCDCPCFNEFGYHFCNLDDERRDVYYGRPEWCTLAELPEKHGRLIDADYLMEHLYTCETNGRPMHIMELDERLACIDEVPTVIEAEGEE